MFRAEPVNSSGTASAHALSQREVACLALVAEGLSNRDIGVALGISHETVKSHLDNIRLKLGAADRANAVAIALRLGIV